MASSLNIVKKFFPKVKKVTDADEPAFLEVTEDDSKTGSRRDHNNCAFARACARKFRAQGVIVSVYTAYIVKGDEAIRYHLPPSVSREVVSFDRNARFEEGLYELSRPSAGHRLGARQGRANNTDKKNSPNPRFKKRFAHFTGGIRAILGTGRPTPEAEESCLSRNSVSSTE
jgi:hypothetical protein